MAVGAHAVQFFENEDTRAQVVDQIVVAGLDSGEAVVLVGREPQRQALEGSLRRRKLKRRELELAGRLVVHDAAQSLDALRAGTSISPDAFNDVIGRRVRLAAQAAAPRPFRAFGEMVALRSSSCRGK